MTVLEQRYRAVPAVEQCEPRYQVAAQLGVSHQTLHTWITRYRADGPAGLASRRWLPAEARSMSARTLRHEKSQDRSPGW